jgi:hypothetical protein
MARPCRRQSRRAEQFGAPESWRRRQKARPRGSVQQHHQHDDCLPFTGAARLGERPSPLQGEDARNAARRNDGEQDRTSGLQAIGGRRSGGEISPRGCLNFGGGTTATAKTFRAKTNEGGKSRACELAQNAEPLHGDAAPSSPQQEPLSMAIAAQWRRWLETADAPPVPMAEAAVKANMEIRSLSQRNIITTFRHDNLAHLRPPSNTLRYASSRSLFACHAKGNPSIFRPAFFSVVGRNRMTVAIAFRRESRRVDAQSRQFSPHGVGARL